MSLKYSDLKAPKLLVREDEAIEMVTAPLLWHDLLAAGWVKAAVSRHKCVLYPVDEIIGAVARIKTEGYPKPVKA